MYPDPGDSAVPDIPSTNQLDAAMAISAHLAQGGEVTALTDTQFTKLLETLSGRRQDPITGRLIGNTPGSPMFRTVNLGTVDVDDPVTENPRDPAPDIANNWVTWQKWLDVRELHRLTFIVQAGTLDANAIVQLVGSHQQPQTEGMTQFELDDPREIRQGDYTAISVPLDEVFFPYMTLRVAAESSVTGNLSLIAYVQAWTDGD